MIKSIIQQHNREQINTITFSKDFGLERKIGPNKIYNFKIMYEKNKEYVSTGILLIENHKGQFYKNLENNTVEKIDNEEIINIFLEQLKLISNQSKILYNKS